MKKRFSVFLTGSTTATAGRTHVIDLDFDIQTLIPVELQDKLFLLHSSFNSDGMGTVELTGIRVSLDLPKGFNKSYPAQNYVALGIADPVATSAMNFKFRYEETACFVRMVECPRTRPLRLELTSVAAKNIPENTTFSLNLTFEQISH